MGKGAGEGVIFDYCDEGGVGSSNSSGCGNNGGVFSAPSASAASAGGVNGKSGRRKNLSINTAASPVGPSRGKKNTNNLKLTPTESVAYTYSSSSILTSSLSPKSDRFLFRGFEEILKDELVPDSPLTGGSSFSSGLSGGRTREASLSSNPQSSRNSNNGVRQRRRVPSVEGAEGLQFRVDGQISSTSREVGVAYTGSDSYVGSQFAQGVYHRRRCTFDVCELEEARFYASTMELAGRVIEEGVPDLGEEVTSYGDRGGVG